MSNTAIKENISLALLGLGVSVILYNNYKKRRNGLSWNPPVTRRAPPKPPQIPISKPEQYNGLFYNSHGLYMNVPNNAKLPDIGEKIKLSHSNVPWRASRTGTIREFKGTGAQLVPDGKSDSPVTGKLGFWNKWD